ncbi:hypothetical protein SDC9_82329 [bioreactor metagenome]|uniref:Uncharacterized protein n=1 Tax=bioreactor metagenome TaxID=1076179 RepID=A0A644Z4E8_9ZZZZ
MTITIRISPKKKLSFPETDQERIAAHTIRSKGFRMGKLGRK